MAQAWADTNQLNYKNPVMQDSMIAFEPHIAEQTVKLHRQSICEILGVKSVPEIIRIAEKARAIKL